MVPTGHSSNRSCFQPGGRHHKLLASANCGNPPLVCRVRMAGRKTCDRQPQKTKKKPQKTKDDQMNRIARTPSNLPIDDNVILVGALIYDADDYRIGTVSGVSGTGPARQVIIDLDAEPRSDSASVQVLFSQLDFGRDHRGAICVHRVDQRSLDTHAETSGLTVACETPDACETPGFTRLPPSCPNNCLPQ